jgi:ABC-2 type transport system ATP-binding protein
VVDLNNQGVTIVLTTHYLEEAEQLCDRIAIINHGRLITDQPTRELVGMMREKIVVLTLDRPIDAAPQHEAFAKSTISSERELRVTYDKDRINAGEVLALVQSLGYGIVDVSTDEADLEDVFVKLTSGPASAAG